MYIDIRKRWLVGIVSVWGSVLGIPLMRETETRGADDVTWDNAPPVAHKLLLTDEEFRSLFPKAMRSHAGYCPVPCTHNLKRQPDGRPVIVGKWEVDRKTGKIDTTYRIHRPGSVNTAEKANPRFCQVSAYYRYAPPDAEQPRPATPPVRRLDMTVFAFVNAPYTLDAIRKWQQNDAETHRQKEKKPEDVYSYRYVEDLGFGLDRNTMFIIHTKNGQYGEVHIKLNSVHHALYVAIDLSFEDKAVTPEQAISIARNAAAIIAQKAFGAAVQIQQEEDEHDKPGFTDLWATDRPGPTPEQDHHVKEIRLGQTFRVACIYRLPPKPTDIEIKLFVTPGPDAITASRNRCQRMPQTSIQTVPLEMKAITPGHSLEVMHLADGKQEITGPVSVRSHEDKQKIAYFTIRTDDPDAPFILGPGTWEVQVVMRAYLPHPDNPDRLHRVELSQTRIPIFIADDPAFSAKILRPTEEKNQER